MKQNVNEINLLKVRDDREPISITIKNKSLDSDKNLAKKEPRDSETKEFTLHDLRKHIEPWLTALFQSEHLSLLAGSGLTHAVHHLATENPAAGMDTPVKFGRYQKKIQSAISESAEKLKRKTANFEDRMRVANELLRGLEILGQADKAKALEAAINTALSGFASSVLTSERNIAHSHTEKRSSAFNTLITFLMSFASRTGTRDRLNIFTTNYDRFIEAGADLAGLHLLDRFVGKLSPVFRSSRLDLDMHYNPPGIRGEPRYLEGVARFTKLHGSLDWISSGEQIMRIGLPFGADSIEPYLKAPGLYESQHSNLMIYPNALKDSETAAYPYVELFRDLAAALCRPNSTLVTYGYSFGDEHINRVIRDMLTIPSTHLVIISYNDPLERIMLTYKELGRPSQISLLLGPDLANLQTLTEYFLPKASIDKTTFRMTELLKHRYGAFKTQETPSSTSDSSQNGFEDL